MANKLGSGFFASLAPSRIGDINPWSWWTNMSGQGQLGLININQMASSKPDVEADIIGNVASYGRQLGRITDALLAVVERVPSEQWSPPQQEAVKDFKEMARDIQIVKAGHLAPTRENLDELIAGVKSLQDTEPDAYKRIVTELRDKLPLPEPKPAHRGPAR